MRFKPILSGIIHSDQNGYIKNRYIGFNIRQIQDIIDYAEKFKVDGAILFLDFSKAFDSLEWDFMYEALKKYGFNKSILQWIKTLYTDIKACISNNGFISTPLSISRGIRQGCPLSSLIFVIAVEILACRLRQDKDIKGFQIKIDGKSHTLKISQLADDSTLFLRSEVDITNSLNLIEIYGSYSGLILNRSKTEGIWVGSHKRDKNKFENITFKTSPIKSLGIYFSTNAEECKTMNFNRILEKSEKVLTSWSKRNLTLIGKVTVIKSLIIPNITFLANVSKIDKENITKFKKIIYKFLWGSNHEKVKRSILSKKIKDGGLNLTDLDKYIEAINLNWVKRLKSPDKANWKIIPQYYFDQYGENFLLFSMNLDNINSLHNMKTILPEFYFEIANTWIKNRENSLKCENFRNIRQQIIWGNKYIKIDNKCLLYKDWIKDNIIYVYILNNLGEISQDVILNKLTRKTNWMAEILKLKKAIPKTWVTILQTVESRKTSVKINQNLVFECNSKRINIQDLTSKDIYHTFIYKCKEIPLGLMKWERVLATENLKSVSKYTLQFISEFLSENVLKVFRWKLLHYIVPCKLLLFQWKISATDKCSLCNQTEDYEHMFITCGYLKQFWTQIETLFEKINLGKHLINLKTLIFGYKISDNSYYSINYILTLILFTIHKAKCISDHYSNYINIYIVYLQKNLSKDTI